MFRAVIVLCLLLSSQVVFAENDYRYMIPQPQRLCQNGWNIGPCPCPKPEAELTAKEICDQIESDLSVAEIEKKVLYEDAYAVRIETKIVTLNNILNRYCRSKKEK